MALGDKEWEDIDFSRSLNRRLSRVTRVEVINHRSDARPPYSGRALVARADDMSLTASLQDEGRTLKLFLNKRDEPEQPEEDLLTLLEETMKLAEEALGRCDGWDEGVVDQPELRARVKRMLASRKKV